MIMLDILNNNSIMGSPIFRNFKTQASFYFKDKIRTARLALTDVTPAQLLTEEATNGNPWPPDTRTMKVISRAAFEVDDYWRIVEILHQRLLKFDQKKWRDSYDALILLEHLLTHGPKRIAEEFRSDHEDVFREMGDFQYLDEKGFNWGLSVRKLSQRVLELLQSEELLAEERARARNLSRVINGFGSLSQRSAPDNYRRSGDSRATTYGRSKSYNDDYLNQHDKSLGTNEGFLINDRNTREKISIQNVNSLPECATQNSIDKNHPFCESNEFETTTALLSDSAKKYR